MSDTYVECLVKQKQKIGAKILKVFLIILTVIAAFMFLGFWIWPAFFFALAFGAGAYFVGRFTNLEFEYLYLDREISIDKIMDKTKRKRVASYSVDKIEIVAPINSYHLDEFKNRQVKVKDYSVGEKCNPDLRYVMYCAGGEKIIFNPSEGLVKALKNVAPRKVFSE